jgi:hypothetical protein
MNGAGGKVKAPPQLPPAPKIKIPGAGSSTIRQRELISLETPPENKQLRW